MDQSANILAAAEQIRPHLYTLLDNETARAVDEEISALLEQARAGTKVDNKLIAVMSQNDSTHEWMAQFSAPQIPESGTKSIQTPLGLISVIEMAEIFRCPEGDHTWYRHSVGETIPECPIHHVLLVKVN